MRAETVQTGKCSGGCCQRGGWKCTKRWASWRRTSGRDTSGCWAQVGGSPTAWHRWCNASVVLAGKTNDKNAECDGVIDGMVCSAVTLHILLKFSVWERHRPDGVHPEKGHKNDLMNRTPHL